MNTGEPAQRIGKVNVHNVVRLRADAWNRMRDFTKRLSSPFDLPDEAQRSLVAQVEELFTFLATYERFFAFPGARILAHLRSLFVAAEFDDLAAACVRVARLRTTGGYRRIDLTTTESSDFLSLVSGAGLLVEPAKNNNRPYFELLVVDEMSAAEQIELRSQLHAFRTDADEFVYEVVVVSSLEDALLATMINRGIQAVVPRFSFPLGTGKPADMLTAIYTMLGVTREELNDLLPGERTAQLGAMVKGLRPELDAYRITDASVEVAVASDSANAFNRHFYQTEDYLDLHVSILKGVHDRYETPFFDALRRYSLRPTGMFHALPVSRGRTIARSHWITDFGEFYGPRLFLAETSATTGGLDSLLQPTGSLKRAQELASRAFGSDHTFFVTNGTSTANKIVMQALVRPGDIVLLSHDCHKSHPYGVILAGASPIYLDPYALTEYSMYGGVTLETIKSNLLALKAAGKLARVRLLLLTNLTFDGITYDPYRIMKEVLAIKPDIVFVWDEAWFAYGRFSPLLRQRTAMVAARRLDRELRSPEHRAAFEASKLTSKVPGVGAAQLLDPDKARVRVYATHSTHKTLTALRQGSMIHVHDTEFERGVEEVFHEAYMTHTSTSPNYQILASLDVGRRQVELEGSEMVADSIELAMTLRERIAQDPLLQTWFSALGPKEMIPKRHRGSGLEAYPSVGDADVEMEPAWTEDEFVLDPTRVTLCVGRTGLDGDSFKKLLMDKYDIHINKTARNSVLFLIHIGMSRGTIAHLLKVLRDIATERTRWVEHASEAERMMFANRVHSLMHELPPLPNFSRFHATFLPDPTSTTPEGDMRRAFFESYSSDNCEFIPLDLALLSRVERGADVVSASFLTPYPPGFPVLVPGQVVSPDIVKFLLALDVKEIHGLNDLGIRVFRDSVLTPIPQRKQVVIVEAAKAPPQGAQLD